MKSTSENVEFRLRAQSQHIPFTGASKLNALHLWTCSKLGLLFKFKIKLSNDSRILEIDCEFEPQVDP